MPTVLRIGPYRFFFYSNELGEPPHIHVQRENSLAKFWLEPVTLAVSIRFSSHELNKVQRHILNNREKFLEAYNEYFGG